MTKETIDEFFKNEKKERDYLFEISDQYNLNDFVKVNKDARECILKKYTPNIKSISGCIYNHRKGTLCLNTDSVEQRLTVQYLGFLFDIINLSDRSESVRYILAFHYIELVSELAYLLTVSNNAPFRFCYKEMLPWGKQNYKFYTEVFAGDLHGLLPYISEDTIIEYNRLFYQYSWQYHSAKHFSLMAYMLHQEKILGTYDLRNGFEDMISLFVFRYKALFSSERISPYMTSESETSIINSLFEI